MRGPGSCAPAAPTRGRRLAAAAAAQARSGRPLPPARREAEAPQPVRRRLSRCPAAPYHRRMTAVRPKSGPRPVRAPRGTELSCKGWQQEAALRMLMNNLDPEVAEDPDHLIVYGGTGRAARQLGGLRRDRRRAAASRERRDPAGRLGQAGRRLPHHDRCAARAHRQRQPGAALGDLGAVPRARARRADDVRPDDGRVLDLHRDAGDHPGHLRDVRRGGAAALRRLAARDGHPHGRPRRDGRRAAAGGDDERGRLPDRRGRRGPGTAAARVGLRRRADPRPRRGDPPRGPMARRRRGPQRGADRQCGGRRARAGASRLAAGRRDRPDVGARSAERLRAGRHGPH